MHCAGSSWRRACPNPRLEEYLSPSRRWLIWWHFREVLDAVQRFVRSCVGRNNMTELIDSTKTFRLIEERMAKTTNPRHLLMLQRLLDHAMGEAKLDLDLVMSTLVANPRYIAWGAPADMSPVGRQAVRSFYEDTIVKGGQWFLELDMDRIVVDDDTIVTEGVLRSLYYGADAASRGFPVDDQNGFYLLTLRMLVVWPFDADGFIKGEETYSAVTTPDFIKKIETSEVPQKFRDFVGAR